MECTWYGKLPAYWSVANWALLTDKHMVVLSRELETNRRKLQVVSINEKKVRETNTIYNVIIGAVGANVLLSKVQDARTHDQLSRFGWFTLSTFQMEWEINQVALVEKFSIPYTLDNTSRTYSCGLLQIDLTSGTASTLGRASPISGIWSLGQMQMVQNSDQKGLIAKQEGRTAWQLNNFSGSQYRGALGDKLIFLLPNDEMVCIDKRTGDSLWQVQLDNVTNEGRTKGTFDSYNETYARNSFIADIVINQEILVWSTKYDEFCAYHIPTGRQAQFTKQNNQFLVDINDKYVMLLTVDEEQCTGTLALYALEELLSEHF
ncbi:hypothetical protein FE782_01935 [Paenibacillus antri]|uniref:PQQ-like beta-propeller repeat protein n=1 Tax=Paenibacillus antri TaxID=2582848 RepID=A0A5R9GIJ5_9BACL|nr:hypothetical protein [Paenibacillus antri]TLS54130.1 hypothetical protein FE782_01935 [Paenibacillus antri]